MTPAKQAIQQAIRNAQPFLRVPRETEVERKAELATASALVREAVPAAVIGGCGDLAEQLRAIACKLEAAAR